MNRVSSLVQANALGLYSDSARRLSDTVNLAVATDGWNVFGFWMAARLSDGGTDGHMYPDKATAVRHQLHETQCAYLRVPPSGMSPQEAEIFLEFNRQLYANGHRMPDPGHHIEHGQTLRIGDLR
jgi:hypothetical protein